MAVIEVPKDRQASTAWRQSVVSAYIQPLPPSLARTLGDRCRLTSYFVVLRSRDKRHLRPGKMVGSACWLTLFQPNHPGSEDIKHNVSLM